MHIVVATKSSSVCVRISLTGDIRLIAISDKMEERNVSSRT